MCLKWFGAIFQALAVNKVDFCYNKDMKELFDRTFFRFAIGFILIISVSFAIMAFSGYYQDSINASVAQ